MTTNKNNQMSEPIIKMNTKTVNELRSIALLSQQSAEEMARQPPRINGEKRPVPPVNMIPSPQEMDEFEKEEMKKSRAVAKNKLNEWHDWLVDYVPKPIKNGICKAFLRTKKVY